MKSRSVISAAFLLLFFAAAAPAAQSPVQKYIEDWSETAVSEMQRSGVPASITLAQGLLESSAGQSALARKANNHFGIKCHSDWTGGKFYKDDDEKNECFRVYASAELSFRDHSDFLRFRDRYKSLFDLAPTDYKGWAKGLSKAGYATDKAYADKLIKVIEENDLSRFDRQTPVELVPESPAVVEKKAGMLPVETISISFAWNSNAGVPCVKAEKGQTYETIAREHNLFVKEILKWNDAAEGNEPRPGELVYVQRKRMKAPKGVDKYVVGKDGETLRDVSQRYAVRLDRIRKMNPSLPDELREGDTVVLR